MNLHLTSYPDRASWLAARSADPTAIGASEVGAILGVSPFRGPWDVWTDKRAHGIADEPDVLTGDDDEAAPDIEDPLVRGQVWEEHVRRLVGLASGLRILGPGALLMSENAPTIARHVEHPWATCSPDGWTGGTEWCGAELKTDASLSGWKWGKSGLDIDGIEGDELPPAPPHYLLQCWWSLEVTGLNRWLLGVLLGSFRVRWYIVHRNDKIQDRMMERVAAWRERHLVGGEPPDRDASEACLAHYRALYLGRDGVRPATLAEGEAARALHEARQTAKAAEARARLASSTLLASMSDASRLTTPTGSVLRDSRGALRIFGNP